MRLINKLANLVYRNQKTLEVSAIFLFFSAVAVKFNDNGFKSVWSDYPMVTIMLALITVLLAIVWIHIEKQKTQQLIDKLKNDTLEGVFIGATKVDQLSSRQKEVFDLIIQGKSNKEITAQLIIELSTLKTHINQIYKILGVTTRKEAKSFGKHVKRVK